MSEHNPNDGFCTLCHTVHRYNAPCALDTSASDGHQFWCERNRMGVKWTPDAPCICERRVGKDRRIRVAVDLTRNRAQFVVSDDGQGFDVRSKLPSSADEAMESDGGRGLILIQAFMNEVLFNEAGNEMRMTLKDLRPIDEDSIHA